MSTYSVRLSRSRFGAFKYLSTSWWCANCMSSIYFDICGIDDRFESYIVFVKIDQSLS